MHSPIAEACARSARRPRARRRGWRAARGTRASRPSRRAACRAGLSRTASPWLAVSSAPPRRRSCCRRAVVELLEGLVEAPHAAEARRHRDLRHRQPGLLDQLLGEQHAAGLGDRDRRGAEVLAEQPPQLPLADAQPVGQAVDVRLVERAGLDQAERAGDRVRGAAPGGEVRRGLRPAAQAGAEAGALCRRGGRVEAHVLALRGARRADRPAVDAGGLHPHEQPAVEAGVAGGKRAVAGVVVHIHAPKMGRPAPDVSRFSDLNRPRCRLGCEPGGSRSSPGRARGPPRPAGRSPGRRPPSANSATSSLSTSPRPFG